MATEDVSVSLSDSQWLTTSVALTKGTVQYSGYVIPKGSMIFQNVCQSDFFYISMSSVLTYTVGATVRDPGPSKLQCWKHLVCWLTIYSPIWQTRRLPSRAFLRLAVWDEEGCWSIWLPWQLYVRLWACEHMSFFRLQLVDSWCPQRICPGEDVARHSIVCAKYSVLCQSELTFHRLSMPWTLSGPLTWPLTWRFHSTWISILWYGYPSFRSLHIRDWLLL